MGSRRFLPMNVTTRKSECDPKQRIRQLEVAIEHALAAVNGLAFEYGCETTTTMAWLRSAIQVSSFAKLLRLFGRMQDSMAPGS